jgi:hypothetical protein
MGSKQIITGGSQMGTNLQSYGVPGTGVFYSIDPNIDQFMQISARTPFPAGMISNLRLNLHTDKDITGGSFTIEVHSSGWVDNTSGTGLLIKTQTRGSFDRKKIHIAVEEGDLISIKVANDLKGPDRVSFSYSFEFELD